MNYQDKLPQYETLFCLTIDTFLFKFNLKLSHQVKYDSKQIKYLQNKKFYKKENHPMQHLK